MARRGRGKQGRAIAALALIAAAGCAGAGAAGTPGHTELVGSLGETPYALLQMRRAGCASGSCPVYGVSIFIDGTVMYEGRANVGTIGQQHARISSDGLNQLVTTIHDMDFLDSAERCCICSDENLTRPVVVDYRPGTVQKTVVHDEECRSAPPSMAALERAIDRLTGVAQWTDPIATPPGQGKLLARPSSDTR
jgi:hypothetical protein